ncbi:HEAT repeat domain-containing protein [Anatilimnocola floriformis]|uniref:HEAT repeat domain-containing protein n=1 Tax=Anatilimnocola floriformis TaxID=2948575 RepID=UPI0020C1B9FA|nr:hypothetical protein [Anatilimnocola floriformis]
MLLCGAFTVALADPASSLALDVFALESGGVVEGEWLNRDELPLTHYRVRTGAGLVVSLQLTQVRQASQQRPALAEYQRLLPTFADTAADQWKLAEWCKVQQLTAERNLHVARVLDLDEKHAGARRAMGYVLLDGKWVKHAETRRQDGYELYKGRWRTIQEIELLEISAKRELEEKEWLGKIRRWRRELDIMAKAREAAEYLSDIHDPVAIGPLVTVMKEDKNRRIKMLFADVLAEMNNSAAERALVSISLSDADEEIFHYCLDKIVKANPPHIADGYIRALKDTNNVTINRAGIALGRLGDRTAIAPLIAALVTTHTQTVGSTGRGAGDTYSQSFSSSSNGTGGTNFRSNEGPKTYVYRVQNQHVLDGLAQLAGSGVNFGFNSQAWQFWYAQEKQAVVKPAALERRQ